MILQALVSYYEALAAQGKAARPGWGEAKISYALELEADGALARVVPLSNPSPDGKKQLPRQMQLPAAVKRTVGIDPNFLWDNSSYLLGFDAKGKPERSQECFDAAKTLHLALLSESDDPFAQAICRFFETWNPETAAENPVFVDCLDDIQKSANLTFLFNGTFACESPALRRSWQTHYDGVDEGDGETMRCLVTGETVVPEKIHPPIKNVVGAQSSGAALVSFNAPAFCSYGKEQNINAPVGKYAAFAYTTALNLLLSDRDHVLRMGDTTLVFWSEDAEPLYQDAFLDFANGGGNNLTDSELKSCVASLLQGLTPTLNGVELHPDNRFYILGLAPNAARLSVRFFLQGNFGDFLKNVQRHYNDIQIVSDGRSKEENLPLWRLLRETVNLNSRNKDALPQLAGDTIRAVLTGQPYPATLYQQTQLRIRAERDVTRGRAGIIKAYLLRIQQHEKYEEALTVELNENTRYQPYVLGRLFSVLEAIQQKANPGINATIKDKYFTSAGATPGLVFPVLLNLSQKHLHKLEGGLKVYYEQQLTELMGFLTEDYPAHYNLYAQGIFQLGYYHQTQKRYEKKDKKEAVETMKEETKNV
jgi:CRISPR-associated protein Csd1